MQDRQLIEVRWDGLEYGVFDAIQSLLVEHPQSYYMATNKQWLCYLTRDYGLLKLINDFTMMSDRDIDDYIIGVLELLYSDQGDQT